MRRRLDCLAALAALLALPTLARAATWERSFHDQPHFERIFSSDGVPHWRAVHRHHHPRHVHIAVIPTGVSHHRNRGRWTEPTTTRHVSFRDPQSGLPTGQRQHGPFVFTRRFTPGPTTRTSPGGFSRQFGPSTQQR